MDKITSNVRRSQWIDIIHACNTNGHTKKAWCEQNGINIKSFYYCQRQLRHEAYDVQSVALSPEPEVTFAQITVPSSPKNTVDQTMTDSATSFCPDAVIRTCTLTIEVSNYASREVDI